VKGIWSEVKWSEGNLKWSEVKGFWSTEKIEYFQEQGLESDKWSEVKWSEVTWSEVKWSVVTWSEVKWRDFEVRRKSDISKNRGWKVISEVKWSDVKWSEWNLKWGEYQLNAVKGKELRRGVMWSVYDMIYLLTAIG